MTAVAIHEKCFPPSHHYQVLHTGDSWSAMRLDNDTRHDEEKAENLRKRKTLDQFFLVAVGEEPVDSQNARLDGTRHFVQAHLENPRAKLTISVDALWPYSFQKNVGGKTRNERQEPVRFFVIRSATTGDPPASSFTGRTKTVSRLPSVIRPSSPPHRARTLTCSVSLTY